MTLDDIVQAERELEQIYREIETERAHHGAQMVAGITGLWTAGLFGLLAHKNNLTGFAFGMFGVFTGTCIDLLVPNIRTAVNLIYRQGLQLPALYHQMNEDCLIVDKLFSDKPLVYDRFVLQNAPLDHLEKYLTEQAQAHRLFCDEEKHKQNPRRHRSLSTRVQLESVTQKVEQLVSEDKLNSLKLWSNLCDAPFYWVSGTTGKRMMYDNIRGDQINAANYHLFQALLSYGAEFFQQGYQRTDLTEPVKEKLSQCVSAAEDGAAFCRNLIQFFHRRRESEERLYQFFYPPEQKLHRWLPL